MTDDEILIRVNLALRTLLGADELVTTWWNSDNYEFDLKTPQEMWTIDSNRVADYVFFHHSKIA